jgi:hypothetical protein
MSQHDEPQGWMAAWDQMISLVGTDLSDGQARWGADAVEPGTIRRYLEPIELACPIHYDLAAARAAGYDDVTAPSTAVLMYTLPSMWSPGDPTLFDSADRDAQPARSPINNEDPGPAPRTKGFFATDIELDFIRPVLLGERLGTRGRKLLSCLPKQTSVGRGAFCVFETEIVSDTGDVVARMRTGTYAYDPHPASGDPATAGKETTA